MGIRGNSGFIGLDLRTGSLTGDTKGIVGRKQHFLERTNGRFEPPRVITTGSTQIGNGTTGSENVPVRGFYDFSWSAMIFTSSEMSTDFSGAKTITSLAFDVKSFSANQGDDFDDIRVFCGHYNADTFSESNPDEDIGNRSGVTDWTQCTNNGYTWLPQTVGINYGERIVFDTPFEYNGTDRLIIKIENREGEYLTQPRIVWDSYTDTASVAYDFQDNTYPTGGGTRTNVRPNIVVYYEMSNIVV